MPKKTHTGGYADRDIDVMNILWNSEKSLTASEIVSARPELELTVNTVQAVLRKLLNHKLIRIADIVYSGSVLCRSYEPAVSPEEFSVLQWDLESRKIQSAISKSTLFAALLETEKDPDKKRAEIKELEQLLEKYKKETDQ